MVYIKNQYSVDILYRLYVMLYYMFEINNNNNNMLVGKICIILIFR